MNAKPRPIHPVVAPKKVNDYRIPQDGPLTPRLRAEKKDLQCVGFVHEFEAAEDYD